jgi:hypothetical protein
MSAFTKLFGTHSERELKRIYPLVDKVESYRDAMGALSDEEVKNLKGAAAEQAARVTPSMEMLANEYNALASTLPTHRGRTPAGVKSVLDSVADYLVKGILSCDDAHERAQHQILRLVPERSVRCQYCSSE